MEEQTAVRYSFRRRRLLKSFLGVLFLQICISSGCFAVSWAYLKSLSFKTDATYIFTATNTTFSLDIASKPPSEVTLYINAIPDGVELMSVKKQTYIPPVGSSDTGYGTHVDVTVRFSSVGDYRLFDADLQVKEGMLKVPFPRVHVFENTQILVPELSVGFDAKQNAKKPVVCEEGEHLTYTVNVKFAANVQDISWKLPENSVFKEIKRHPIAEEGHEKESFSPAAKPVITFDWQPLLPGDYKLPEVSVTAMSYNGSFVTLTSPSISVAVRSKSSSSVEEKKETGNDSIGYFADSFETPALSEAQTSVVNLSRENVALLAKLHTRERHSLPFFSHNRSERIAAEEALGLPVSEDEPSVLVFILFCALFLADVMASVVLLVMKKNRLASLCLVTVTLLAAACIFCRIETAREQAVFAGGPVFPIPENDSSKSCEVQSGGVVEVHKHAGKWLYISFRDTAGWVPSDSVIFIK